MTEDPNAAFDALLDGEPFTAAKLAVAFPFATTIGQARYLIREWLRVGDITRIKRGLYKFNRGEDRTAPSPENVEAERRAVLALRANRKRGGRHPDQVHICPKCYQVKFTTYQDAPCWCTCTSNECMIPFNAGNLIRRYENIDLRGQKGITFLKAREGEER